MDSTQASNLTKNKFKDFVEKKAHFGAQKQCHVQDPLGFRVGLPCDFSLFGDYAMHTHDVNSICKLVE
jgi:hypothetical protein